MMAKLTHLIVAALVLAQIGAALPALTTGDGLSVTFGGPGGSGDAGAVNALAINGAALGGVTPGGFRVTWHGESGTGTLGPQLLVNGNFASNSTTGECVSMVLLSVCLFAFSKKKQHAPSRMCSMEGHVGLGC